MNRWSKQKRCRSGGGNVRLSLSILRAAILFIPGVLLSIVLRPYLGGWSTGVVVAILILLCMRLKPA